MISAIPDPARVSMLTDVLQCLLGDAAMLLCFFAPGYTTAWATNVMEFRGRSLPEKILWSIALSGPISIFLTCIIARAIPAGGIMAIFVIAAAMAGVLFVRDYRSLSRRSALTFDRNFWIVLAAMLAVGVYCIAATVGIETRHSLYESIVAADWSIRIPLTEAAMQSGFPPRNPMFAIAGHAPPMRYYYFWYKICALIVRLTHISPRASLTATTAWSAYSLLSVLFLTIKYLGSPCAEPAIWNRPVEAQPVQRASVRRICVIATGLTCVMGLDLITAIHELFSHPRIVFPDIEAWRADRMPSWVGAILFAPHHVAGVAFGVLGFLLLAILPANRRQQLTHSLLAGICFAMLVGTSTYLSLCFALAGFLLILLRIRYRQWRGVAVIAACTVVAVLTAMPFLHELTMSAGYSAAEHPKLGATRALFGNHMFKIVLSNWHEAYGTVGAFSHSHGLHLDQGHFRYLFPLLVLPFFFLMELTFYVFVIWYQAKIGFRQRGRVHPETGPSDSDPGHRFMLWALFCGFAVVGLFISSEPTQGINDLERHAGLALRLVLIAWAAPMFANAGFRLRSNVEPSVAGRWVIGLTAVMIVIGLGGELWQVTMDRIYFALISHGLVESRVWFGRGAPFLQIRRANDVVAANFPADAIVQANPEGPYEALFLLYGNRQTAAGDESCEAAFGGDVDACKAENIVPLHRLFGGTRDHRKLDPGERPPEPADPANMTDQRFADTCHKLHLSVIIASKDDAAWGIPNTWVYSEPALYADDATRVIPCPR